MNASYDRHLIFLSNADEYEACINRLTACSTTVKPLCSLFILVPLNLFNDISTNKNQSEIPNSKSQIKRGFRKAGARR